MPLFENNGNGGVTIPKWLLPIVIGLFITGAAAWGAVSFQARSALPRIEAAQTYQTKTDARQDQQRTEKQLDLLRADLREMNRKLDTLLAR